MSRLLAATHGVLDHALALYADDPPARALLAARRAGLGGPLRVALAGTVKAGKSTLLNALVGERVAPTGVAECTRIVTTYADAPGPRIDVDLRAGAGPGRGPLQLPVHLDQGALRIDLGGLDPAAVAALRVGWPSGSLRATTLVDTPGVDSTREDVDGRARAFLLGADGERADGESEVGPAGADVVVHLVRHLRDPDVAFLEAFGDRVAAGVGAAGTLVVLSRADEVGGGRPDAVLAARQVAARYRDDPGLRPWCTTVTTVAGLLAETARTLRGREFTALRDLAALPRPELDALLVSADRFCGLGGDDDGTDGGTPRPDRLALLDRFGLFGVRTATTLLRRGVADSATLAAELARRSGLDELRELIDTRFLARRDVFQARAALETVEALVRAGAPGAGGAGTDPALAHLAGEVERVRGSAHAIVELDLLTALRVRPLELPGVAAGEAERLLGEHGPGAAARLGADPAAGPEELRALALDAHARWREHADHPLADRRGADAARTVVRSLEAVLAPPRPGPVLAR